MSTNNPIHSENYNNVPRIFQPYSGVYDLMASAPFVNELRERHVEAMHGLDSVLDGGCGTGLITARLAQSNKSVVGIDAIHEMLANAASRLTEFQNANLYYADAHNLPFADSSFDGHVSNNVIYFVDNPNQVLSEMVRVTKPGGKISIASARPCSDVEILINALHSYLNEAGAEIPPHDWEKFVQSNRDLKSKYKNLYEPDDASALLKKLGCSLVLAEGVCYLGQNFYVLMQK